MTSFLPDQNSIDNWNLAQDQAKWRAIALDLMRVLTGLVDDSVYTQSDEPHIAGDFYLLQVEELTPVLDALARYPDLVDMLRQDRTHADVDAFIQHLERLSADSADSAASNTPKK